LAIIKPTLIILHINVWRCGYGKITICLEAGIESKMRAAAKSINLSQSKWVANLIKE
jgi:hypothetical protein